MTAVEKKKVLFLGEIKYLASLKKNNNNKKRAVIQAAEVNVLSSPQKRKFMVYKAHPKFTTKNQLLNSPPRTTSSRL